MNQLNEISKKKIADKNFKEYKLLPINSEKIGNIPLPLVFKKIFCPNDICIELEKDKCFMHSLFLHGNDKNIVFTHTSPETDKIPDYYNNLSHSLNLFTSGSKTDLLNFIEEVKIWDENNKLEYNYNLFHPIPSEKKRFMGPSSLTISNSFKIHFISPLCLIVEVTSNLSGFMMMDTFYSIVFYKFETTLSLDSDNKIVHDTVCSIGLDIVILKNTLFSGQIESNGKQDNTEMIKEVMFPNMMKVLNSQSLIYYSLFESLLVKVIEKDSNKDLSVIEAQEKTERKIKEIKEENVLEQFNFVNMLTEINEKKLKETNFKSDFKTVRKTDEDIGDIPLPIIFKKIFCADENCLELNQNKTFLQSLFELNDKVSIEYSLTNNYEVPKFFNDLNYSINLFTKGTKKDLEDFLKEVEEEWKPNESQQFVYKYDYVIPKSKQRFMGPKLLKVVENYSIYFISPLCMIIEKKNTLSGYTLIDSFYYLYQYKFESEVYINDHNKVSYKTKFSFGFDIVFIKTHLLQGPMESNGNADNILEFDEVTYPALTKIWKNQWTKKRTERNKEKSVQQRSKQTN